MGSKPSNDRTDCNICIPNSKTTKDSSNKEVMRLEKQLRKEKEKLKKLKQKQKQKKKSKYSKSKYNKSYTTSLDDTETNDDDTNYLSSSQSTSIDINNDIEGDPNETSLTINHSQSINNHDIFSQNNNNNNKISLIYPQNSINMIPVPNYNFEIPKIIVTYNNNDNINNNISNNINSMNNNDNKNLLGLNDVFTPISPVDETSLSGSETDDDDYNIDNNNNNNIVKNNNNDNKLKKVTFNENENEYEIELKQNKKLNLDDTTTSNTLPDEDAMEIALYKLKLNNNEINTIDEELPPIQNKPLSTRTSYLLSKETAKTWSNDELRNVESEMRQNMLEIINGQQQQQQQQIDQQQQPRTSMMLPIQQPSVSYQSNIPIISPRSNLSN